MSDEPDAILLGPNGEPILLDWKTSPEIPDAARRQEETYRRLVFPRASLREDYENWGRK